jgi:hypothetical protein
MLNKLRSFDYGKSSNNNFQFNNTMLIGSTSENYLLPTIKLMPDLITKFQLKAANLRSGKAINKIKLNAPKVIDNLLKIPAMGYAEFVSQTYSVVKHSESSFSDNRTRSVSYKYLFVIKYCSYCFLSFYF